MTEMKTKDEETAFRVQEELSGPQMATRADGERDSSPSAGDMIVLFTIHMFVCLSPKPERQEPAGAGRSRGPYRKIASPTEVTFTGWLPLKPRLITGDTFNCCVSSVAHSCTWVTRIWI